MRKTILLLFMAMAIHLSAQDTDSLGIQAAIDACVSMRDAVASNDNAAIRQSAEQLRACNTVNADFLKCLDDSIASLNGHLVFDEEFADSIAEGKDVYQRADDINRSSAHRGHPSGGSVLTKTCFVRAGKSTKYSFAAKGHQEIAVVAEAGGLLTMKIHVTNQNGLDEWHNDTKDTKRGRPQRKRAFELPNNYRNIVELEVINCGKKDCSFVVISNI